MEVLININNMTYIELYSYTKYSLRKAGIENADLEASSMFDLLLGIKKETLFINGSNECSLEHFELIENAIIKRVSGYPLQYITGIWDFYGYKFYVGDGVLIPRSDTEILVDVAVELVKDIKKPIIADLCSGSGCIGITLARLIPSSTVHLVEYSDKAIEYIKRNIELNNIKNVFVHKIDVLNIDAINSDFSFDMLDLIVSNPPYLTDNEMRNLQKEVKHEPEMALFGGNDGLDFYRGILTNWIGKIKEDQSIVFEVGLGQAEQVSDIIKNKIGFYNPKVYKDFSGIDRVVSTQRCIEFFPSAEAMEKSEEIYKRYNMNI